MSIQLNLDAKANLEWSNTLLDGETVTYETAEEAVQALGDGCVRAVRSGQ